MGLTQGQPQAPSAHRAPPFPGRGTNARRPQDVAAWGHAAGRTRPTQESLDNSLLHSKGLPGGLPRPPITTCREPWPHSIVPWAEAHPRCTDSAGSPRLGPAVHGAAGRVVQPGDRASPVRQTENRTSAARAGLPRVSGCRGASPPRGGGLCGCSPAWRGRPAPIPTHWAPPPRAAWAHPCPAPPESPASSFPLEARNRLAGPPLGVLMCEPLTAASLAVMPTGCAGSPAQSQLLTQPPTGALPCASVRPRLPPLGCQPGQGEGRQSPGSRASTGPGLAEPRTRTSFSSVLTNIKPCHQDADR